MRHMLLQNTPNEKMMDERFFLKWKILFIFLAQDEIHTKMPLFEYLKDTFKCAQYFAQNEILLLLPSANSILRYEIEKVYSFFVSPEQSNKIHTCLFVYNSYHSSTMMAAAEKSNKQMRPYGSALFFFAASGTVWFCVWISNPERVQIEIEMCHLLFELARRWPATPRHTKANRRTFVTYGACRVIHWQRKIAALWFRHLCQPGRRVVDVL